MGGPYTSHAIRRAGLRPKESRGRYLDVGPRQQKKKLTTSLHLLIVIGLFYYI